MKRHNLAENLAKFYLREGRGASLVGFLVDAFKMVVYVGGAVIIVQNKFGIVIPSWVIPAAGIAYIVGCFILGWIDEKLGFWKFQNNYSSKELTPFFEHMDAKIDKILHMRV